MIKKENIQKKQQPNLRINKHDHIFMLTSLEKCSQLYRQQKALIRRKLRQFDDSVLAIFIKHKKPINYQILQQELKRYAMKNKLSKQNKQNQHCSCSNEKKNSINFRLVSQQSKYNMESTRHRNISNQISNQLKFQIDTDTEKQKKQSSFNRLKDKLKFKNKINQDCIPIDVKYRNINKQQNELEQHIALVKKISAISSKTVRQKLLDSQNFQYENLKKLYYNQLANQQQDKQNINKLNAFTLNQQNQSKQYNIQNISSLEGSSIKDKSSFHETEKKLITQLESKKLNSNSFCSKNLNNFFSSEYNLDSEKIEFLKEITIFKNKFAEDILTYFFQSPRKIIPREQFIQKMSQIIMEIDDNNKDFTIIQRFINLIMSNENFINPIMLGNVLSIVCQSKQTNARIIYNLLNRQNKKVLLLQDILIYFQTSFQNEQLIKKAQYISYEIFYLCSKDGKLNYWDLFLIEQTPIFKDLCNVICNSQYNHKY